MYAASSLRAASQPRSMSSGVAVEVTLLNSDDAHRVRAGWSLDLHLVTDLVAHQRRPKGGLEADLSSLRVSLGRPDDAVRLLVLFVLAEVDCAAHRDDAVLGR